MNGDALSGLNFIGRRALPVIRQNEAAECGNACLAMIAGYHGLKTDIGALRRRFPTSARGMNLRMLSEAAQRLGFAPRALKAEIEELNKLRLPAILHWDLNHFVVLKAISGGKATIHDPARGAVTMPLADFGRHYTGVVLELAPTASFKKADVREKLKFSSLWSKMSGLTGSLVQVIVLSLVLQAYVLAAPQYMQVVVDTVLPSFDENLLLVLALGFGLFVIVNAVASVIRQLVMLYAGSSLAYQVSINLFSHLSRLPLPFFERRHMGDIVSRFSSIDPIKDFLVQGVATGLIDGLLAIITLVLLFAYSPMLAGIVLAALAIYLVLRLAMFRAYRNASEDLIIADAVENSNFIETVRGVLAIKAFAQEDARQQRWQNLLADSVNENVRVQRLTIAFNAASGLIKGLEHVLVVYLAAGMVMEADFTVGMIFAFLAYRTQFVDAAVRLVELVIQYRMLDLHLDRIADIATAEPEPRDGERRELTAGAIRADGLSFAYDADAPPVFSDVSFEIAPGETIAIVGPSGGGKTTLLKTLMGLIRPTAGAVFADGADLARLDPTDYRRQIASVMQDDHLFAGSLAENISFFDIDPDMERVASCAAQARLDEEIARMPMGLETMVGDMGSTLSGGQMQRILLARALYRQPKILFMDEGTSNLDVPMERAVNASIRALGITRVLVAHRPETIGMADRIFVVKNGGLEEHGPPSPSPPPQSSDA